MKTNEIENLVIRNAEEKDIPTILLLIKDCRI